MIQRYTPFKKKFAGLAARAVYVFINVFFLMLLPTLVDLLFIGVSNILFHMYWLIYYQ